MDQQKIRQQLAVLQRQYLKTKRKLERSKKAALAKAYVQQKLKEQNENEQVILKTNVSSCVVHNAAVTSENGSKPDRCRKPSVSFKLDVEVKQCRSLVQSEDSSSEHSSALCKTEDESISQLEQKINVNDGKECGASVIKPQSISIEHSSDQSVYVESKLLQNENYNFVGKNCPPLMLRQQSANIDPPKCDLHSLSQSELWGTIQEKDNDYTSFVLSQQKTNAENNFCLPVSDSCNVQDEILETVHDCCEQDIALIENDSVHNEASSKASVFTGLEPSKQTLSEATSSTCITDANRAATVSHSEIFSQDKVTSSQRTNTSLLNSEPILGSEKSSQVVKIVHGRRRSKQLKVVVTPSRRSPRTYTKINTLATYQSVQQKSSSQIFNSDIVKSRQEINNENRNMIISNSGKLCCDKKKQLFLEIPVSKSMLSSEENFFLPDKEFAKLKLEKVEKYFTPQNIPCAHLNSVETTIPTNLEVKCIQEKASQSQNIDVTQIRNTNQNDISTKPRSASESLFSQGLFSPSRSSSQMRAPSIGLGSPTCDFELKSPTHTDQSQQKYGDVKMLDLSAGSNMHDIDPVKKSDISAGEVNEATDTPLQVSEMLNKSLEQAVKKKKPNNKCSGSFKSLEYGKNSPQVIEILNQCNPNDFSSQMTELEYDSIIDNKSKENETSLDAACQQIMESNGAPIARSHAHISQCSITSESTQSTVLVKSDNERHSLNKSRHVPYGLVHYISEHQTFGDFTDQSATSPLHCGNEVDTDLNLEDMLTNGSSNVCDVSTDDHTKRLRVINASTPKPKSSTVPPFISQVLSPCMPYNTSDPHIATEAPNSSLDNIDWSLISNDISEPVKCKVSCENLMQNCNCNQQVNCKYGTSILCAAEEIPPVSANIPHSFAHASSQLDLGPASGAVRISNVQQETKETNGKGDGTLEQDALEISNDSIVWTQLNPEDLMCDEVGASQCAMEINDPNISKTALAQGPVELSGEEWTQLSIGDATLEQMEITAEKNVSNKITDVCPHLSHVKTIRVYDDESAVLCICCDSINWIGKQHEVVVCSTRKIVKLFFYSKDNGDNIWSESFSTEWSCEQNENIKHISILSCKDEKTICLLAVGNFEACAAKLMMFFDNNLECETEIGPVISNGCEALYCVPESFTIILASAGMVSTCLYKYKMSEDFTWIVKESELSSIPDHLLGLQTVSQLDKALAGLSKTSAFIWNWETEQLLVSIPLRQSAIAFTGVCHEEGILFFNIFSDTDGKVIAVNPTSLNSVPVFDYKCDSGRILKCEQHGDLILGITETGTMFIWDRFTGKLVGRNKTLDCSAFTWHPNKCVLLCGTSGGLVKVYAKQIEK